MNKVGVVIGSSRPGRIGAMITEWVVRNLPAADDVTYEVIDLAEWNLPMFDEMMPPMMGMYQGEHTKKWAQYITGFQGFIFVTPEYNAGYPAVLKNAIDYLKAEWKDKPSLVISYGWDGGVSANNQLREVLARIGTKATEAHPALAFGQDFFGEDHKVKDIAASYAGYAKDVKAAAQELTSLL